VRVAQPNTSYESGPHTSSFTHGYEDIDVIQHSTAGHTVIPHRCVALSHYSVFGCANKRLNVFAE